MFPLVLFRKQQQTQSLLQQPLPAALVQPAGKMNRFLPLAFKREDNTSTEEKEENDRREEPKRTEETASSV